MVTNNIDIEKLYSKINSRILLASTYYEEPLLVEIIKGCRLKPLSVFDKNFKYRTILENVWIDEFGNSLRFENSSKKIYLNDTSLNEKHKISSDLFLGNSISKCIEFSSDAIIITGEHFGDPITLVCFHGKDEYLRAYMFIGEWIKTSPLLLGLNTLRLLYKHLGKKRIVEIDTNDLDVVLKFDMRKCFVSNNTSDIKGIKGLDVR